MIKKSFSAWSRWIHLYLSMFSFAALFFFAVTGITLNHPSWTENQQKVEMLKGEIDPEWVAGTDTGSVAKTDIVDYFRDIYKVRVNLTEFRIEPSECSLSFDGPGYTAYGMIDRSTGSYNFLVTSAGLIGFMNDLHKGSDTDNKWNAVIDFTAAFLIVVSLTGFIMIFFITKKRSKSLWVAVLGAVSFVLLCMFLT